MHAWTKTICVILISIVAGCSATLPKNSPPASKTYKNKVDVRVMGSRRSYLVHVPPAYEDRTPLPLVVVIHGAFETAWDIEKRSGFSDLADREGFVALYPNGMGLFGFLQHWNAGHCCGKAAEDGIDDVGFIATAIDDVRTRLSIDPDRTYAVGFSNGGMLAYRFAAEKTGTLAALAVVAATIGGRPSDNVPVWRPRKPSGPLPVIVFHGLDDDAVPPQGGVSSKRGGKRTFLSIEDSIRFWVTNNGCNREPLSGERRQNSVRIQTWKGCRQGADVVLYLLEKWGHVWPGLYYTAELNDENPLKGFDAAGIIWDFFKAHHRNI
ncbi:MAG: alpha/beta hydrolase [Deltaproteobacteria bacterium]|jgi:polyhydroxybutyrate depolymerase|nr:alpha/beta hydrolase [Deltaproteobacteria bacterium]